MKFEIEIDGVNTPIEDVENAIKDILYNQLDMELGVDYNKFNVNVIADVKISEYSIGTIPKKIQTAIGIIVRNVL